MSLGVRTRLRRIGADDRYVVIPMDHGVTLGAVDGLVDLEATTASVVEGGADAVLTQKGVADRAQAGIERAVAAGAADAGYVAHLNGSTVLGPDANDKRRTGTVEEAVRLGADAVSYHINVGSEHEREQIEDLSRVTEAADRLGVPVLAMAYARGPGVTADDPEVLGHAVRLAEEVGADLVKTAYSGSRESFERVTESTELPVLIAGGEPGGDLETLTTVADAMAAGAAGASVGRAVFQHDRPGAMAAAVSDVVHEGTAPEAALRAVELG
ncbi:fructose-bisphosphate aldolase [Halobacteriales archaeon SW_5_70_135]|nr:MAG: fructose-bisphosphate aldolase [Halobacteriales archaeon SW_5_70_135]